MQGLFFRNFILYIFNRDYNQRALLLNFWVIRIAFLKENYIKFLDLHRERFFNAQ